MTPDSWLYGTALCGFGRAASRRPDMDSDTIRLSDAPGYYRTFHVHARPAACVPLRILQDHLFVLPPVISIKTGGKHSE